MHNQIKERHSSVDMPRCWPGGFFADHHGAQILENAANHVWEPDSTTRESSLRERAAELMDSKRHQLYAQMAVRDAEDEDSE